MSPPSGQYGLMENLAGALDVMLGRASGIGRLDLSVSGIWWSFSGLALAGLIDASSLSMLYNNSPNLVSLEVSKFSYVFGHMIVALIGYCASLVCLFLLCRTVGEQKKFPVAIAVHNWAAPIVSLAFLPLLALAFFLGGDGSEGSGNVVLDMISVLWIGVLVLAGLRLLRLSLDLTMSKAAVFFVITAAVSLVTTQGLESLLGLANPT